ncbi:beta-N-acetylglucosaminidase domain-containing protein [Actinophytocola sp.]|uniref:beta-N-acetylglucosaminidase domain-containing protein n=1 Tax=Actinophytocola sp. TaxID=1872138 RepID=UPI003899C74E
MRSTAFVVVALVLSVVTPVVPVAAETPPLPQISPTPQSVVRTSGQVRVPSRVRLVTGRHSDPAAVRETVALLRSAGARDIVRGASARMTVYVGGPGDNRGVPGADPHRVSHLPAGGYLLASEGDRRQWTVLMSGVDGAGQYYAAQTLRQLIQPRPGPDDLAGSVVVDWPALPFRGTVEGYYGTPWTQADRLRVLDFQGRMKLGTYVYAPKDDPYHRDRWREPYPAARLAEFRELAARAADRHVDLVFSLSPGADICYSDDGDFRLLIAKTQALYDTGVRSFALFFDDIAGQLTCPADVERFGADPAPTAAAQASLLSRFTTEFLATHPGGGPLLTVPTEYNGTASSTYKQRFAALVPPAVHVLWTGQQVISPTITDADVAAARDLYAHPLVLWDNYPVNDGQPDRLYLGPLTGRGPHPGSSGLLANPMTQAEPSKLALATVADYAWHPAAYDPNRSWANALRTLAPSLAAFADANRTSPLEPWPAPVLGARIADFEAALAAGHPATAAALLTRQLTALAATRTALAGVSGDLDGPAFVASADPWLRKAEHLGTAGAAIVASLTAEQAGDLTTAWRQRVVFEESVTAGDAIPQTLAPGVLDPFLDRAGAASRLVTLSTPTPGTPLTPGDDLTLTARVRSGDVPITSVRYLVGDEVIGTATTAPYTVVWHGAPRRLARTVVEVTDATGAVVRSAPVNLMIGAPDRALLVHGDDGNPGTAGLAPGEEDVRDRLEHLGFAVDPILATSADPTSADGEALVVVSSSVASGDVGAKFRDVAVPVIAWEAFVYDDMGMATSSGEQFRATTVDFTDATTPLSAGLHGPVQVYRQEGRIRWAVPAEGATVAATMPGDPTRATVFGFDTGAPLLGGLTAPARRVGLYLGDEGLLRGLVADETVHVFDAAVTWATAR